MTPTGHNLRVTNKAYLVAVSDKTALFLHPNCICRVSPSGPASDHKDSLGIGWLG